MVKLPKGVKVHKGGQTWRGEIPAELCPEKFKPTEKKPTNRTNTEKAS